MKLNHSATMLTLSLLVAGLMVVPGMAWSASPGGGAPAPILAPAPKPAPTLQAPVGGAPTAPVAPHVALPTAPLPTTTTSAPTQFFTPSGSAVSTTDPTTSAAPGSGTPTGANPHAITAVYSGNGNFPGVVAFTAPGLPAGSYTGTVSFRVEGITELVGDLLLQNSSPSGTANAPLGVPFTLVVSVNPNGLSAGPYTGTGTVGPDGKAEFALLPLKSATPTPTTTPFGQPVTFTATVTPSTPTTNIRLTLNTNITARVTPFAGLGLGLRKVGGGTLQLSTDANGNFTLGNKLTPGTYTITFGGSLAGNGGPLSIPQFGTGSVGQPRIIGLLVGLLLPAVQKVREAANRTSLGHLKDSGLPNPNDPGHADASPCAGCFPNILIQHAYLFDSPGNDARSGAKTTFTIGKDGYVGSINWGDGTPTEPVNHVIGASFSGDANHTVVNGSGPELPKNHEYQGVVVALGGDSPLSAAPQSWPTGTVQFTGKLVKEGDQFSIVDGTSNVKFQLTPLKGTVLGDNVVKHLGRNVHVVAVPEGSEGGSDIICETAPPPHSKVVLLSDVD